MVGIIQHELGLKFIFGGKSFVTFLNTKTLNRFTYNVFKHKKDDIYFVNVLTSPDIYTFIGTYKNGNSPKSKISSESQSVKVFNFVVDKLSTNTLSDLIEIYHDGRCGKCGKQLTTPKSVSSGFGPECSKKITKQEIRDAKISILLKEI